MKSKHWANDNGRIVFFFVFLITLIYSQESPLFFVLICFFVLYNGVWHHDWQLIVAVFDNSNLMQLHHHKITNAALIFHMLNFCTGERLFFPSAAAHIELMILNRCLLLFRVTKGVWACPCFAILFLHLFLHMCFPFETAKRTAPKAELAAANLRYP